ncbi:MAG: hypothetical protein ABI619_05240, partial [Betaproteobacteria bacterium]
MAKLESEHPAKRLKPSSAKTRSPQPVHDVCALLHRSPHQTGTINLDHQDNRLLIEPVGEIGLMQKVTE